MPVAVSYPGVYIEEIPSGVRTITGVATSITAFIGRARRGPTNEPVMVNSFGDFERAFGGLQEEYLMSYAVRDFFLNGGSQAIIVRLVHPNFATDGERDKVLTAARTVRNAAVAGTDVDNAKTEVEKANNIIQSGEQKSPAEKKAAKAVFDAVNTVAKPGATLDAVKKAATDAFFAAGAGTAVLKLPTDTDGQDLALEASNPGEWGNALRARVDYDDINENVAKRYALNIEDLFNLSVRNMSTGVTERFLSLAVKDSPRHVDRVLQTESNLVRTHGNLPAKRPKKTDDVNFAKIDNMTDLATLDKELNDTIDADPKNDLRFA
jgi:Bacteriophage tail sheath protein